MMHFDPVTNFLNRSAWVLWVVLWISLSLGVGQEEFIHNPHVTGNTYIPSIVAAVLLVGSVALQITRQIFYSNTGPILVKIARWLILGATTIFAFRMTYMVIVYGGAQTSMATLIGVSILAIGLSLNAIGMMQHSYFQEYGENALKWNTSWRNF